MEEVKRPKKASVSEYRVSYESEKAEKYKYKDGDIITITPVVESPDKNLKWKVRQNVKSHSNIKL